MGHNSELRERIISHARSLFFEQGFSRITTEELSRQLGISKKTLYREFGSKLEIVREAVHSKLAEVDGELSEVFDDDSRSFIERFGAQMEVASGVLNSLSKSFLTDLTRHAPDLWEEIQQFRRKRIFSRMEDILSSGQREGMILREANPRLTVMIIVTVADNLLVPEALAQGDLRPQEVIRHIALFLSRGILTEAGRARVEASGLINTEEGENND